MLKENFVSFVNSVNATNYANLDTATTGFSNPVLMISTRTLYFSVVNAASSTQVITFSTTDDSLTKITGIAWILPSGVNPNNLELNAFEPYLATEFSFDLVITFTPTQHTDQKRALLRVTLDNGVFDINVFLDSSESDVLSITPILTFPETVLGSNSVTSLNILNTSNYTPTEIIVLDLYSALAPNDFVLSGGTLPMLVLPGQSKELAITFTPQHNSTRFALLSLSTSKQTHYCILQGTGIDSVGVIEPIAVSTLTAVSEEIPHFYSSQPVVVATTLTKLLPYQNISNAPFFVQSWEILNNQDNEFEVGFPDTLYGTVVRPNELIFITIYYTPTTTIAKYHNLVLSGITI